MPSGMNSGNMTEDMNSTVIKGTPRQNSIKPTQTALTIGICERRPRASTMPMGSEATMPTTAMTKVRNKPPQSGVSMSGSVVSLMLAKSGLVFAVQSRLLKLRASGGPASIR